MKHVLGALVGAATLLVSAPSIAQTTLTIATVNNGDIIRMQGLTSDFTAKNPDVTVKWVTLEENVLRQRVTTDMMPHSRMIGSCCIASRKKSEGIPSR